MSRIHEALQQADRERKSRAASTTDTQQAGSGTTLPQLPDASVGSPANNATDAAFTPLPQGPSHEQELDGMDTMTSHCRTIQWNPVDKALIFSQENNHQYKAEVFRTLRSRLYRLRDQVPLHSLLITSTLPAEGKTFIAHNLSQAIAQQHGRRALLIDADLRMPRQHMLLGAPQSPGLTDYLRGEADEHEIIQRGLQGELYFIPCGQAATHPVELIGNGRMKGLLDRMTKIFDWVILDSPPMAPVSDAGLLADMCDGALLVVRAAMTPYDLAQKTRADFKNTPLVGVVLNGCDGTANYGSYYYTHYSGSLTGD